MAMTSSSKEFQRTALKTTIVDFKYC